MERCLRVSLSTHSLADKVLLGFVDIISMGLDKNLENVGIQAIWQLNIKQISLPPWKCGANEEGFFWDTMSKPKKIAVFIDESGISQRIKLAELTVPNKLPSSTVKC